MPTREVITLREAAISRKEVVEIRIMVGAKVEVDIVKMIIKLQKITILKSNNIKISPKNM